MYLNKKLISIPCLFHETMDGKHHFVRKCVVFNPKDRAEPDAFFGRDGSVKAEMTALGMEISIREQLPMYFEGSNAFLNAMDANDAPIVILLQRSGFFPLAIIFGSQLGETRALTDEEALEIMPRVQSFAIADLN